MTRRVLITGGSSGLGLGLARAFAERGDAVALVARDPKKLADAAASIRDAVPSARVIARPVDVRDENALGPAVDALAEELGGLDVLVSSAGVLREGYFETLPESVHREIMDINYFGTLHAIRAALPHLVRSGRGHLVNIASISSLSGVFGYSAYCASKYALLGLTETLRYELAPQGIKVQIVCPGEFDSPMVDALDTYRTPENREHTLTIPKVGLDVVVRDTVRGMDSERFMIVPGRFARLSVLGIQHVPALGRKIGDLRIRSVYVGPKRG